MRFPTHLIIVTVSFAIVSCTVNSKDDALAGTPAQFDARQYEKPIYQVKITGGIEYGRGTIESGDMPLLLDLYEPVGDENSSRPGLLIIHGGGFIAGTRKQEELVMFAHEFASRGYLVASMDYRLSRDAPVLESAAQQLLDASQVEMSEAYRRAGLHKNAAWAASEDALLALQWLQDSTTTLDIDPSRIAVLGSSAGAFTALNLAYRLNEFAPHVTAPNAVTAIWGTFENDDTTVLETGEPPLLIIHGTEDKIINFKSSLVMFQRAQDVGVPVEFVPLQGHGHGLGENRNDFFTMQVDSGVTVFDKIVAFTNASLFEPDNLPLVDCDAFGDACP